MKRNLAIIFSVLFIFAILQMSSLSLRSNSAQPPLGFGYAGDPGQTTCNHCHVGSTITDGTKFTIKLSPDSAGLVGPAHIVTALTQYIPDSTEWISIQLNGTNGATPKYGFQLTALDSLNNLAGTFTLTNPAKTSTEFIGGTGRRYVGHKNADMNTTAWSFKWKAPHSGRVTFYYTGNIANGDGHENTPGDSVFQSNSMITAGPVLGIADMSPNISAANVFPVPFSHDLYTELSLDKTGPLAITLMSLEGAVIKVLYDGEAIQGKFRKSFDLSGVAAGAYFVRMQSGSSQKVIKIIKI